MEPLQGISRSRQNSTALLRGDKMLEIKKVRLFPMADGFLICDFNTDETMLVDIRPSMKGVLEKLKEPEFFKKVYVDEEAGTVAWPGELHLDPETLYNRGVEFNQVVVSLKDALERIGFQRVHVYEADELERA